MKKKNQTTAMGCQVAVKIEAYIAAQPYPNQISRAKAVTMHSEVREHMFSLCHPHFLPLEDSESVL